MTKRSDIRAIEFRQASYIKEAHKRGSKLSRKNRRILRRYDAWLAKRGLSW